MLCIRFLTRPTQQLNTGGWNLGRKVGITLLEEQREEFLRKLEELKERGGPTGGNNIRVEPLPGHEHQAQGVSRRDFAKYEPIAVYRARLTTTAEVDAMPWKAQEEMNR